MKPMLKLSTLALLAQPLVLAPAPARAQSNLQMTAAKNQMTAVPAEVRLIEEESLPSDPTLQQPAAVPGGSTVAMSHGQQNYGTDASPKDNGMKLYRFMLAPGEPFSAGILSDEATVVTQRFGLLSGPSFTPSSDCQGQISRTNRLSRQQRSTKIDFRNTEARPFPLLLIVYGQVGHPYKIQISRESAK